MQIRTVSSKDSPHDIHRLYDIMIHGYKVTEIEIWGEDYKRMSLEEFQRVIEKGELIGAWIDDVPVGSIHTYPLNNNTHAFGLFSADFAYKGKGIGRRLIVAAEEMAVSKGADFMELEILRLKHKELLVKQQLSEWYQRLGYQLVSTTDFAERKPDKAEKTENFVAPSVFDCYRKALK